MSAFCSSASPHLTPLSFAQVVAGMKYDVVANVYTAAGCRKMEFEVWDRFGARTLNSFENLGDC